MKNLFSLLERFSKVLNKDQAIKENIVSVIRDKTKVNLSTENILLKEGVLEVRASATAKNELNLKEELVKNELNDLYKIKVSRILYK